MEIRLTLGTYNTGSCYLIGKSVYEMSIIDHSIMTIMFKYKIVLSISFQRIFLKKEML